MLDLTKISRQMQGFSQHLTSEVAASHQRLELAQQFFKQAVECQQELVQRQEEWRNRILFANA
ncbi:MAG: nuclease, partial [Dolichospermum sp.]